MFGVHAVATFTKDLNRDFSATAVSAALRIATAVLLLSSSLSHVEMAFTSYLYVQKSLVVNWFMIVSGYLLLFNLYKEP